MVIKTVKDKLMLRRCSHRGNDEAMGGEVRNSKSYIAAHVKHTNERQRSAKERESRLRNDTTYTYISYLD